MVKPNIGCSGTGIVRFDTLHDLWAAADADAIDLGIDRLCPADYCRVPDQRWRANGLADSFPRLAEYLRERAGLVASVAAGL